MIRLTCLVDTCGRPELEHEIERLKEQLAESRDVCRIQTVILATADLVHGNDQAVLHSERLLRAAVEKERDDLVRERQQRRRSQFLVSEVPGMLKLKERIRRVVYDSFPEIDPERSRSWVSQILDQLSLLREDLRSLARGLTTQKRRGSLVLLAPVEFEGPRFHSLSVTGRSGEEVTIPFEHLHWKLPPGGWVVAHGCTLSGVYVGNQVQAQAPGCEFCLLTDELALGGRLQARIRFEE